MKLARPAIAVAAAALVAAGSVPVVQHMAAPEGTETPVKPVTVLDPAVSVVDTTIAPPASSSTVAPSVVTETPSISESPSLSTSASPSPATTTTTKVVEEVVVAEDPAKMASEPVDGEETVASDNELKVAADSEATHPNVNTLAAAPKTFKGTDQRWFGILERTRKKWSNEAVAVKSESMGRDIPVALFRATDKDGKLVENAPTVYLLNGAGGSEQDSDWVAQAYDELYKAYGRSGVNVVVPMEGAFSYYVDWAAEPPVDTEKHPFYKGKQMWSTFLAHELPQAVEPYLGANDRRAVAGLSMAATSVLLLAEHNPGFYDAVGSFSGCAATSSPLPWAFVDLTVSRGAPGVMTPEYVFGPRGSDYNRHNDALVNAAKLKGTALYISTGTGLAGEGDMAGYLKNRLIKEFGVEPAEASSRAVANAFTLQVEGGAIEAAMNACTHDLLVKLKANDVKVDHAELRNVGTHSWGSWRDDVKLSYDTVFKEALGL